MVEVIVYKQICRCCVFTHRKIKAPRQCICALGEQLVRQITSKPLIFTLFRSWKYVMSLLWM